MSELRNFILDRAPPGWTIKPLWSLFRRRKQTGYPDEELLSVYRNYGVIPKSSRDDNFNKESEDLSGYQLVAKGALVTNKMKAWQGSIAISRYRGIVSPAYYVYEPLSDEYDQFLHYLLRSDPYIALYGRISKGVRVNQWDLEHEALRNIPIMLPDHETQKAIAAFLDRETARIDQLVEKKRRLVELLDKKEQAIISNSTCYGLNPNADFLETDIEWFKKIPAHWTLSRFNRLISERVDYRGRTPEKVDEGVFLVTARNVRSGRLDYNRAQEFIPHEEWVRLRKRGAPEIGDVIFTTEAPLGEVANVDRTDVAFAQRIMKFRGVRRLVDNYYLKYLMMSDAFQWSLSMFASGSTASGIKSERLAHLYGLIPPVDEQKDIVQYIDSKRSSIYPLREAVSESIDRLGELRSALITAAVTGQIDVATWSKRGETDRRLDQIAEEMSANPSVEDPVEAQA